MMANSRSANRTGDRLSTSGTKTLCPFVAWPTAYITWLSLSGRIRSYWTRLGSLCFVVTWEAERRAVGRVTSKLRILSPRLFVMHFEANSGDTATLTCIVVSLEYGSDKDSVFWRFVMSLAFCPVPSPPSGISFTDEIEPGASDRAARPVSFQKGLGDTKNFVTLRARCHKIGAFVSGAFSAVPRLPSLNSSALGTGKAINGCLCFITRKTQTRPSRFIATAIRTCVLRHTVIVPIGYEPCN